MSELIKFGKYKDTLIQVVYENDKSYCQWLLNQEMILENNPKIKEFLTDKFNNSNDQSYIVGFGKYKNKSLKQIKALDPNYLNWIYDKSNICEKNPKLREELRKILV